MFSLLSCLIYYWWAPLLSLIITTLLISSFRRLISHWRPFHYRLILYAERWCLHYGTLPLCRHTCHWCHTRDMLWCRDYARYYAIYFDTPRVRLALPQHYYAASFRRSHDYAADVTPPDMPCCCYASPLLATCCFAMPPRWCYLPSLIIAIKRTPAFMPADATLLTRAPPPRRHDAGYAPLPEISLIAPLVSHMPLRSSARLLHTPPCHLRFWLRMPALWRCISHWWLAILLASRHCYAAICRQEYCAMLRALLMALMALSRRRCCATMLISLPRERAAL